MKKCEQEKIYKYCCGCGLCNNFIDGKCDARGFFRPNKRELQKFDYSVCYCNTQVDEVSHGLWGSYKKLYYGYSKNEMHRKRGSSGGCLTEICTYLLEQKKVDCIIQVRKDEESLIKNKVQYSYSVEEVENSCGSRYTASAMLTDILSKIEDGKKYAIVAKPCDIAVLKSFLNKNKEIDNIEYLLSFFCGGTPSYQANKNLLKKMKVKENLLKDFTYRGNGWPGLTTAIQMNGEKSQIEYEESWGKILGRDLQEICRFCWDGVGASADISCGDGWYIIDGRPSFAEGDGRNVIFARTEKGDSLLNELKKAKRIEFQDADISELELMQPGQFMRKTAMFVRILAMRLMRKSTPNYRMMELLPFAMKNSIYVNFKMFGGTIKRIKNKKIV